MVFAGFLASTAAFAQEARQLAKGQTLYLPIYSHMAYGNLGKSGCVPSSPETARMSRRGSRRGRGGWSP